MRSILLAVFSVLMIQGCASQQTSNLTNAQPQQDDDYFKHRLLSTSDAVANSLRELSEIEQAVHFERRIQRSDASGKVTDPLLLQKVTMSSLTGNNLNFERVVERLSDMAKYEVHVFGTRPVTPILVTVPKGQYRLIDLLQDVGMQAGSRATVYVKRNRIEILYDDMFENS